MDWYFWRIWYKWENWNINKHNFQENYFIEKNYIDLPSSSPKILLLDDINYSVKLLYTFLSTYFQYLNWYYDRSVTASLTTLWLFCFRPYQEHQIDISLHRQSRVESLNNNFNLLFENRANNLWLFLVVCTQGGPEETFRWVLVRGHKCVIPWASLTKFLQHCVPEGYISIPPLLQAPSRMIPGYFSGWANQ